MIIKDGFRLETNTSSGKTEMLVTRKVLAEYYFRVSTQQVVSYTKASNYSTPLLPITPSEWGFKDRKSWYTHTNALQWHKDNISQKNSPKESKYSGLQSEEDYDSNSYDPLVDNVTTKNMKLAKELESALNEKIKREQAQIELEILKKDYIPIEEADKTVAESVRTMLSELYNMIENMPSRLKECKTEEEIKNVLEDEFEDLINEIKTRLTEMAKDE